MSCFRPLLPSGGVGRHPAGTGYCLPMENMPFAAADEVRDERQAAEPAGHTEELLIEEISIDGMCGVY